jgi:hypothetical protein
MLVPLPCAGARFPTLAAPITGRVIGRWQMLAYSSSCARAPVTMHALQRMHRDWNERARAFLTRMGTPASIAQRVLHQGVMVQYCMDRPHPVSGDVDQPDAGLLEPVGDAFGLLDTGRRQWV